VKLDRKLAWVVLICSQGNIVNCNLVMNQNATIEELRRELTKLQVEFQILEKSHRRLIGKVLTDRNDADYFAGQMVVDRTMLTPAWLKGR
jgi:hypothetical protein